MRLHPHRWTSALVAALVAATALAPAARADTEVSPLALTPARALAVDPGTGRVFIAGGDGVAVYQPDGTFLKTIPDIPGASGMDVTQGSVWVNESAAGTIARIDPGAMTVTKRYVVGAPVGDDLTIIGGVAWIGRDGPWAGVGRFDLATSAYAVTSSEYDGATARLGASTTHLLAWDRGVTNSTIYRRPTTAPFDAVAIGTADGALGKVVSDATGSRLWATGSGQAFQEYDGTTLAKTGVKYQGQGNLGGLAWSGAHGGILVGVADASVVVFKTGTSAPVAKVALTGISSVPDLDISPDGNTAYLLAGEIDGTSSLRTFDLRPTVNDLAPASVIAGAPTKVTVTGRALGGTTQVHVAGTVIAPSSTTPGAVTFTTPASLAAGTHPVVLSGPTGAASTTITVTASTGALLSGTVRIGTAAGVGVGLTLTGGGLGTPRTTMTGSNGTYSFAGLAAGPGYALTVHDPADGAPDQVIGNIGLLPNVTTSIDVDLSRPRPHGEELARTELGSSAVRDLVVFSGTGDVVIAAGDEVDILDADGRLLARIQGLFGARSLSLVANQVYVGLADAGRIVRIDLATATITGSWPLGRATTGEIAASGDKVWFVDGDDQWTRLRSLDPATGAIGSASDEMHYVPDLRTVTGSSNRFLASEPNQTALVDGSSAAASIVAKTNGFSNDPKPVSPLTSSASTGRIYDATGRRFRLTDLAPDGVRYPGAGPPASTGAANGLVAIGGTVSKESTPFATHDFEGAWTATGLGPDGAHLYTTIGDELVVHDLAPHIDATSPEPHYPGRTATIEGSGLGVVQEMTLDGIPVPFVAVDPGRVDLDLDGVSPGLHRIAIATPWGTTAVAPLAVSAPKAPGAPTGATATPAVGSLTVGWTVPSDDGGRAITGYVAAATPGSATCTTTGARTCAFTTLTPGTAYTFTVRATNDLGAGSTSAPSAAVRMPTLPGVPKAVTATAGGASATVRWSVPDDDGGLPVSSYRVCWSTDPAVPQATATCKETTWAATSLQISGLTPTTSYYATVAAINAVGSGPTSAPSAAVIPFTTPGTPTNLVASTGPTGVTLSWTPPADDGGSPITGYGVCQGGPGPEGWCLHVAAPATSFVLPDDLLAGMEYTFRVFAISDGGWSDRSEPVTLTIPNTPPRTPGKPTTARGNHLIRVTWSPPYNGGEVITGYRVCTSADPAMAGATCTDLGLTTQATITGLPVAVPRYATVAAVNALGTSAPSPISAPATPIAPPDSPSNVSGIPNVGTAFVQWTAPPGDGGDPVSGYLVTPYIGAVAQPATAFTSAATSQQITGLVRGVGYTFEVRALNEAGAGAPSPRSATVTTLGAGTTAPFASWDAFVARQRRDLTGDAGTEHARYATVTKLTAGTLTPAAYIDGLIGNPWFGPTVEPTARLYWAYFGRIPDHGGLEYWSAKRRSGTTLIRISASFAGSNEFKRVYGSLSNSQFVDLVYRNVLGRAGDAGGRSYWIGKLNTGASRGQVMANFSESGEYVRKQAADVGVVEVYAGLLDRSPTTAELARWRDQPARSLIDAIRLGDEYAELVS